MDYTLVDILPFGLGDIVPDWGLFFFLFFSLSLFWFLGYFWGFFKNRNEQIDIMVDVDESLGDFEVSFLKRDAFVLEIENNPPGIKMMKIQVQQPTRHMLSVALNQFIRGKFVLKASLIANLKEKPDFVLHIVNKTSKDYIKDSFDELIGGIDIPTKVPQFLIRCQKMRRGKKEKLIIPNQLKSNLPIIEKRLRALQNRLDVAYVKIKTPHIEVAGHFDKGSRPAMFALYKDLMKLVSEK